MNFLQKFEMPIYEFYCQNCDIVYNFFSKSVNTEKIPNCPKCKKAKLKRQVSVFANISRGKNDEADNNMPPLDGAKMEKAMDLLAREADKINEDDPRQTAMLMRKLSDVTGINIGPGMEEALSRIERGEDPDKIEAEIGDLFDEEEQILLETKGPPEKREPKLTKIDETLYEL